MVKIGDTVEYVDVYGRPHNALVTIVWDGGHVSGFNDKPSINLVYVSDDDSHVDQYGRQIARNTSVVHESVQAAHGFFWRELE